MAWLKLYQANNLISNFHFCNTQTNYLSKKIHQKQRLYSYLLKTNLLFQINRLERVAVHHHLCVLLSQNLDRLKYVDYIVSSACKKKLGLKKLKFTIGRTKLSKPYNFHACKTWLWIFFSCLGLLQVIIRKEKNEIVQLPTAKIGTDLTILSP